MEVTVLDGAGSPGAVVVWGLYLVGQGSGVGRLIIDFTPGTKSNL